MNQRAPPEQKILVEGIDIDEENKTNIYNVLFETSPL